MIDIKLIRENIKLVKENIKKKFQEEKLQLVDKIAKKDEEWRSLKAKADKLRQSRNSISKQISEAKKQKKSPSELLKNAKEIPEQITEIEEKTKKLQEEIKEMLLQIPNIIHKSVPIGKDDSQNKEIKKIGKPKKFNFPIKNHIELAEKLGIADFDTSAKTSGNGNDESRRRQCRCRRKCRNSRNSWRPKDGHISGSSCWARTARFGKPRAGGASKRSLNCS